MATAIVGQASDSTYYVKDENGRTIADGISRKSAADHMAAEYNSGRSGGPKPSGYAHSDRYADDTGHSGFGW